MTRYFDFHFHIIFKNKSVLNSCILYLGRLSLIDQLTILLVILLFEGNWTQFGWLYLIAFFTLYITILKFYPSIYLPK